MRTNFSKDDMNFSSERSISRLCDLNYLQSAFVIDSNEDIKLFLKENGFKFIATDEIIIIDFVNIGIDFDTVSDYYFNPLKYIESDIYSLAVKLKLKNIKKQIDDIINFFEKSVASSVDGNCSLIYQTEYDEVIEFLQSQDFIVNRLDKNNFISITLRDVVFDSDDYVKYLEDYYNPNVFTKGKLMKFELLINQYNYIMQSVFGDSNLLKEGFNYSDFCQENSDVLDFNYYEFNLIDTDNKLDKVFQKIFQLDIIIYNELIVIFDSLIDTSGESFSDLPY